MAHHREECRFGPAGFLGDPLSLPRFVSLALQIMHLLAITGASLGRAALADIAHRGHLDPPIPEIDRAGEHLNRERVATGNDQFGFNRTLRWTGLARIALPRTG